MSAYIIVDLGFGDAGKGLLTDFLCRHLKANLVVRYNGGAQAGHNVVTPDGKHHTFSQFGSGTFIPYVKTYLSRHVVIHPQALLIEGDVLVKKGVQNPFSRLGISNQALVITPFHQAANHIRELARGENRHGSCGVGVGETVEDSLFHAQNSMRADDFKDPDILWHKLRTIQEMKRTQISALCKDNAHIPNIARECEIFEGENIIEQWINSIARINDLNLVVPDSTLKDWLQESKNVIFEGAQGVLLDAEFGFYPYTTWSNSTSENALELIHQMAPDMKVYRIGVMRAHAVRHGAGPFPTETDSLSPLLSEHNGFNKWQRNLRYGWFDAVLARYALAVTGGVDFLAITHLDMLSQLKKWKYSSAYSEINSPHHVSTISADGLLTDFRLPPTLSLKERREFTEALSKVAPLLKSCDANDEIIIRKIEELLEQKVGFLSYGASAEDVRVRDTSLTYSENEDKG